MTAPAPAGASRAAVGVVLDLDHRRVQGSAKPPPGLVALPSLVRGIPGADDVLGWVPDVSLSTVGLEIEEGAFGLFATVGVGDSPSALALLVAMAPGPAYAVALEIGTPIGLGAAPLFGGMLAGLSISDLGIRYATAPVEAKALVLPEGAPAQQEAWREGLALAFTVAAGSSQQTFALGPSGASASRDEAKRSSEEPPQPPPPVQTPAPVEPSPLAQAAAVPDILWLAAHKHFGPLAVDRVGIVSGADELGIALDASLETSSFSVGLRGFTLAFPKSNIAIDKLRVALDGLEVSATAPSLQLEGSLVRRTLADGLTEYDGSLVVQLGEYGIVAVGSFAEVKGSPSLFVYGMATGPFGGPPAFYVTGLALGFGYNRSLRLPAPEEVQKFPLISASGSGTGAASSATDALRKALTELDKGRWVPPSLGDDWLAVGVRFTSFEVVKGFALLVVELGHELTIAVLGIAAIQLPREGPPYAYVELTLDAVLRPEEGTVEVTALLTPSSFVIDPSCHLRGGFAFWMWFGRNEHAGDFVVTLGGYHPHFTPPAWYPAVPRLGFDWRMSDKIQLRGDAYFALTPSCAMAGGDLSLTFQSGDLRAWFVAQADFIVYWHPFWFDAHLSVSIGASYRLNLGLYQKAISVDLAADVELWGPPLRGKAYVRWSVVSFAIAINGGGTPVFPGSALADWDAFAASFLPATADPDPQPAPVCRPRAASGLAATVERDGQEVWIMQAERLSLATETVVPATQVLVSGSVDPATDKIVDRVAHSFSGPQVGVYPLGSLTIESIHRVRLKHADGQVADLSGWRFEPVTGNVPESLWGTKNTGKPPLAANLVPALVGLRGAPTPSAPAGRRPVSLRTRPGAASAADWTRQPEDASHARDGADAARPLRGGAGARARRAREHGPRCSLEYADLDDRPLPLPQGPAIDGSTAQRDDEGVDVVAATLARDDVADARAQVEKALTESQAAVGIFSDDLGAFARGVPYTYQGSPVLAPLGNGGPRLDRPTAPPGPVTRVREPSAAAAAPAAPTLRAAFRSVAGRPDTPATSIAHVLDGHAPRDDRLLAYTFVACDGPEDATLRPGVTLLWWLPVGTAVTLAADGALPLRIVALDAQDRLLDDAFLPAGGAVFHAIPAAAAHVAVSCLDPLHRPDAVGWTTAAPLFQVGPQALLGDGVVVRPQAPLRVRSGRARTARGVTSGREVLDANWVQGPNGRTPGFLETTLPGSTRALLLLAADGDPAQAATDVDLSVVGTDGPLRTLMPRKRRAAADGGELGYEVEPSPAPLRVLVQPGAAFRLRGLLGFARPLDEVLADGSPGLTAAGATAANQAETTRVTLR